MTSHGFQTFVDHSSATVPDMLRRKVWARRQQLCRGNAHLRGTPGRGGHIGSAPATTRTGTPRALVEVVEALSPREKPRLRPTWPEGRQVKRCAGFVLHDGPSGQQLRAPPPRTVVADRRSKLLQSQELHGTSLALPATPFFPGLSSGSEGRRSEVVLSELEDALDSLDASDCGEEHYVRARSNMLARLGARRAGPSLHASVLSGNEEYEDERTFEEMYGSPNSAASQAIFEPRRVAEAIDTTRRPSPSAHPAQVPHGKEAQPAVLGLAHQASGRSAGFVAPQEACVQCDPRMEVRRICRLQVIKDGEIPFEARQWTKLPSTDIQDPVTIHFERRLKHTFPCLPSAFEGSPKPPRVHQ